MAEGLAKRFEDDAELLDAVARIIVEKPDLATRDLDLAERAATRAVQVGNRNDASMLNTLARVYFEKGQVEQALATQSEAVVKARVEDRADFQNSLDRYRALSIEAQ